jgi:hypothetical protein
MALTLKSLSIILLLALGVSVLSAGCAARKASSPQTVPTTNVAPERVTAVSRTSTATERSGKVLIRFKEFEFGKDWAADFEIINDTTGPVLYVGHNNKDRFTYCTLAARRQDNNTEMPAVTVRDLCILGTLVSLQKLEPGQSAVLAARKNEIRDLLHITDASTVGAQVGFEVFVGDDRRREMVWSEQITFPNGDPR